MFQTNKYSSKPFDFLILIFWITNIYGSTDGTGYLNSPTFLWEILTTGFPVSNGFRSVELATIILSLFILFKFRGEYFLNKFYFHVLLFLFAVFFLIIVNPNNNATFLQLFLAKDSKFILILPLFFISVCFLKEDVFVYVIKRIFYIGFIVILFNVCLAFFLWLIGHGRPFMSGARIISTTLPQSDVLFYTGLVATWFFLLFLFNKKSKYIYISFSLLPIMFLSYRRTEVILTISMIAAIFLFYMVKIKQKKGVSKILVFGIVIGCVGLIFDRLHVINLAEAINSQLVVFSYFNKNLAYLNAPRGDTGHFLEAVMVTDSMLKHLIFWGAGLQNEAYYLFGQSQRIHSNFAFGMAKYGIFIPVFLLWQFIYFLYETIKILMRNIPPSLSNYYIFNFSINFLLFFIIISGWASSAMIFDNYPQIYIQFVLLISLLKISPKSFATLAN